MTARNQGSHLNLNGNQLQNAALHPLASAPASPKLGQVYFSTGSNIGFIWNGVMWRPFDAAALADGTVPIAALAINPLARANHTGTQLANTISNLQATVLTYTLDTFAAPAAPVQFGGQRLTGLGTATAATDAVGLQQMTQAIAAALAGQTAIKNPARVYAAANITLSGTQTIDGVSLAAGDRVLAGAQSTASQIGLYVVASGAWSLAADGSTAAQWIEGTEILIAEGTTYGGSIFRQTTVGPTITTLAFVQTAKINTYTADNVTLSLTGQQFAVKFGLGLSSSTGVLTIDTTVVGRKTTAQITHDGSTLNFNVTHGLNNGSPLVGVRDTNGNKWDVSDQATSANVVQIQYDTAQPNGTVHNVTVMG